MKILESWKRGVLSEDEFCKAYNVSHLELRQELLLACHPLPELSYGCKQEIYQAYQHGEELYDRAAWIADNYGIGISTVIRVRKHEPYKPVTIDAEPIIAAYKAGLSVPNLVEAFGHSRVKTIELLGDAYIKGRHNIISQAGTNSHEVIGKAYADDIASMLAKGKLQSEIADELGISQATVSRYNPNKIAKSRRQPLDDAQWTNLKFDMNKYNMSELARMYNISRAYIHARLAKEKS